MVEASILDISTFRKPIDLGDASIVDYYTSRGEKDITQLPQPRASSDRKHANASIEV